jgi:polyisoprenoid-binding protein YceI
MTNKSHARAWLVLIGGMLLAAPLAQAADAFKVDTGHSNVIFRIKHLNAAWFYARFNEISGTFLLDNDDPSKSSIDIAVKAESVDTKMEKLNQHLRSADFFSAKEFPTISFKSTSIEKGEEGKLKATGNLTLHGVTKPITIDLEPTGPVSDPQGKQRAGFETIFTIKRSDYGMVFMSEMLGDEVRLIVSMEGTRGQ